MQADEQGISIKTPAEKPRTGAARYRRTEWETRTNVVSTGGVSIQFTSTTIKKRDPQPAVADLMEILKEIVSDGVITEEEARDLDGWLTRNGDLTSVWPINALAGRLGRIMADGVVEQDELDDLREAAPFRDILGEIHNVYLFTVPATNRVRFCPGDDARA